MGEETSGKRLHDGKTLVILELLGGLLKFVINDWDREANKLGFKATISGISVQIKVLIE